MEKKEKLTLEKAISNIKTNKIKPLMVIVGFVLICYVLISLAEHNVMGIKMATTMGQGLFFGVFWTVVWLIKNK